MLLNNAYFSHLRGASIYYAEKIKNISANGKRSRPTIDLNVKVDIYTLQNRFDKVALAYENEKLYFKELVSKAKDRPQNHFLEVLDALSLLKTVFNAYLNLDDDYHCEEVYQIANQLSDAINEVNLLSNYNLLSKDFTLLTLEYYHNCSIIDFYKALSTLNQIDALKNKYPNLSTELIRNHVYEWKTSLFIELGQIDSAQFYIKQLEKIPQFIELQKVWLY